MTSDTRLARYILNGLFATAIHFGILTIALEIFHIEFAGLANFVAAIFGIGASFLGNRYYVFCNFNKNILSQAMNFSGFYCAVAIVHAGTLAVLTDYLNWDFRASFLVATLLQTMLSYPGNKNFVFAK